MLLSKLLNPKLSKSNMELRFFKVFFVGDVVTQALISIKERSLVG